MWNLNSDFSELEEYEDLQIYGVFAVMACCTFVVVTLMQIVVLSQNAYIKKLNDMYSDGKDCWFEVVIYQDIFTSAFLL